ncbi:Alcohol dehydrogenase superfamily zinc-type [Penicillium cinerascens]|uniref:Alcohol dehydrogenase superfamily zinc-type n=1 Tax=Penicillium cinerascens TaxID=70096 RepID=A0A9W9TAU9_9EURO|nr:Alcohol dehydrogenase superfamily zinc-type [Penicillium cinerascens]KAJ5215736.1 Alcohol dehydrogenase superfamily zinc-type [Penicillium cinerascens]
MAIPSTQIAAVVSPSGASANSRVEISNTYPVPEPGEGDILIKLEFSGVCHSDLHSILGDTPMKTDVAGHEGNVPGTFQQYIVSPAIHVTRIPWGLSPELAAPLLCAGIAMYSSIMKTSPRPGDWIAILGAGGGLGHMGVQIAAKKGLRVLAIDKGEKKKQLCLSLGAAEFLDFSEVNIVEAVKASTSGLGAHAVICTANSERAYEQSMQMLRPLGTLVCVGIPNIPFRLPATPFDMIVKGEITPISIYLWLKIVGNSAGTAKEMDELLAMAVAGDVKAHVECYELRDILDILGRLERSEIEGRVVLRIPE